MSVSLATVPAEITSLDRLTTANPTAADLRYRAEFWRAYAMRERASLTVDQYCRILDNCDEMMSHASAPAATVVSLATVRKRATTIKSAGKAATVKSIPADEFWSAHSLAVQVMINRHGLNWKVLGAADTVEVRLPGKLCTVIGRFGTKVKFNPDQRVPAPRFWTGGQLPAGVEVNAPGKPKSDWATNGIEARTMAARAEQIETDHRVSAERKEAEKAEKAEAERIAAEDSARVRIQLGRGAVVEHWRAKHRLLLRHSFRYDRANKFDALDLAADCRRAMATELAAWRDHADRIEADARELATSDMEF